MSAPPHTTPEHHNEQPQLPLAQEPPQPICDEDSHPSAVNPQSDPKAPVDNLVLPGPVLERALEPPRDRVQRLQQETGDFLTFVQLYIDARASEQWPKTEEPTAPPSSLGLSHLAYQDATAFFSEDPAALINELKSVQQRLEAAARAPRSTVSKASPPPSVWSAEDLRAVARMLAQAQHDVARPPPFPDMAATSAVANVELYATKGAGAVPPPITSQSVNDLDQGITMLEQMLGVHDPSASSDGLLDAKLTSNLTVGLQEVASRLVGLFVDGVPTERFEAMDKQLETLIARHHGARAALEGEAGSVQKLYNAWEALRASLVTQSPDVTQRLKALKLLHEEAGAAETRLAGLELQRSELEQNLGRVEQRLQSLKTTMQGNIELAHQIVSLVHQKRLQEVPSRGT